MGYTFVQTDLGGGPWESKWGQWDGYFKGPEQESDRGGQACYWEHHKASSTGLSRCLRLELRVRKVR